MVKNNIEVDVKVKCIEKGNYASTTCGRYWDNRTVCELYHQKEVRSCK